MVKNFFFLIEKQVEQNFKIKINEQICQQSNKKAALYLFLKNVDEKTS